ncbi:MAG: hypothetical protein KGJ13_08715, partial [Patescibacteria group bacterium]|nr:hypothetical protein [Patescibacteria group bacterium]
MSDPVAPATVPEAAPAPVADAPWYQGADQETVGYLQNRGLDRKTPKEAALEAIKAHREAEKFIGAPADKLVRLPKDEADTAGWEQVYGRLGVPADAKGYDFSDLKFSDGSEPDSDFTDFFKNNARKYHLTKQAARDLMHDMLGYMEKSEGDESA